MHLDNFGEHATSTNAKNAFAQYHYLRVQPQVYKEVIFCTLINGTGAFCLERGTRMLSRLAVLLLAAAPEAAQAFVGATAMPTTGRPAALHRPVYSLQMMSKPERSLETRVATKFAALASALVVGAGAMPQASNARATVEEKAPATTISRMIPADVQATVTKAYEDIKLGSVSKSSMATAATVISAGGLIYVLAKKPSTKSSPAPSAANPAAATPAPPPAPAPAEKPAPKVGKEDPLEMLLRTKKAEIASAGPRKPGGTATKMGTRPSPVVTGTATIYLDDSQLKTTPTYDGENWKMGDRPEGYHTKTSSR